MNSCCATDHHHHHQAAAIDPVCGMTVDPAEAAGSFAHEGTTYHFCSLGCRNKFAASPARYLNKVEPVANAGVEYTCPMHPEIVQIGPGSCPLCGMALEPKAPSLDAGPNHEL